MQLKANKKLSDELNRCMIFLIQQTDGLYAQGFIAGFFECYIDNNDNDEKVTENLIKAIKNHTNLL